MKVLSRRDVVRLLPLRDAIPAVQDVFLRTGGDEVVQPLRTVVRVPGRTAVLGVMPAHLGPATAGCFGVKNVVVDPANAGRGLDTHLGLVAVFDQITGAPQAVMEAGAVTSLRTAAASAVATRALAAPKPSVEVAVIGAGVQARLHLQALHEVVRIDRANVWSRTADSALRLVEWAEKELPFPVVPHRTPTSASVTADIICTVTGSAEPLLSLADVSPGAHINAVGACFPTHRELATDLVRSARITVDIAESARSEAGDLLLAAADAGGALPPFVELGAVLRKDEPGREDPREITVFESLGFGALDVAAGLLVCTKALQNGVGTDVAMD